LAVIETDADGVICRFWPDPEAKEDSVVYLWAHPDGVQDPMDTLFFATLLGYLSDVAEGKVRLNLLQVMLMQYVNVTLLLVFNPLLDSA
jgi:hypothetical protein